MGGVEHGEVGGNEVFPELGEANRRVGMCMVRGQGTEFLPSLSSLFFLRLQKKDLNRKPGSCSSK